MSFRSCVWFKSQTPHSFKPEQDKAAQKSSLPSQNFVTFRIPSNASQFSGSCQTHAAASEAQFSWRTWRYFNQKQLTFLDEPRIQQQLFISRTAHFSGRIPLGNFQSAQAFWRLFRLQVFNILGTLTAHFYRLFPLVAGEDQTSGDKCRNNPRIKKHGRKFWSSQQRGHKLSPTVFAQFRNLWRFLTTFKAQISISWESEVQGNWKSSITYFWKF